MTDICFVDCETTGLDPQRHTILEVALIKGEGIMVYWIELTPEELSAAESMAFKVNQYYSRYNQPDRTRFRVHVKERFSVANSIAKFTAGCVLAGNTVKFDQQFLEVWLRRHGACPVWDYHVLDVPTFAAGVIAGRMKDPEFANSVQDTDAEVDTWDLMKQATKPPFKSSKISRALDIQEPEGDDKHTALADARWSKQVWEAVAN